MAKMIYRKDSGEILGVHIFGLHAADLIHEASNAVATRQTVNVRHSQATTARARRPRAPRATSAGCAVCMCARCGMRCASPVTRLRPPPGRACKHTPATRVDVCCRQASVQRPVRQRSRNWTRRWSWQESVQRPDCQSSRV